MFGSLAWVPQTARPLVFVVWWVGTGRQAVTDTRWQPILASDTLQKVDTCVMTLGCGTNLDHLEQPDEYIF